MEDKREVTVPMPGAMHDQIVEQLDYGDSKAAWIREAVMMRLDEEGVEIPDELKDPRTDGGQATLAD